MKHMKKCVPTRSYVGISHRKTSSHAPHSNKQTKTNQNRLPQLTQTLVSLLKGFHYVSVNGKQSCKCKLTLRNRASFSVTENAATYVIGENC